jgi:hypothetical protein
MEQTVLGEEKEKVVERESLINVRNEHAVLMDFIDDLSAKVSHVGQSHEEEFLGAYRVHQVNIQLELKDLRHKISMAQESLTIDGDVAKQEEECAWFRGETSRLTIHHSNMQADLKSMHDRLGFFSVSFIHSFFHSLSLFLSFTSIHSFE